GNRESGKLDSRWRRTAWPASPARQRRYADADRLRRGRGVAGRVRRRGARGEPAAYPTVGVRDLRTGRSAAVAEVPGQRDRAPDAGRLGGERQRGADRAERRDRDVAQHGRRPVVGRRLDADVGAVSAQPHDDRVALPVEREPRRELLYAWRGDHPGLVEAA